MSTCVYLTGRHLDMARLSTCVSNSHPCGPSARGASVQAQVGEHWSACAAVCRFLGPLAPERPLSVGKQFGAHGPFAACRLCATWTGFVSAQILEHAPSC